MKKSSGSGASIIAYLPAGRAMPELLTICMLQKLRCRLAGPEDFERTVEDLLLQRSGDGGESEPETGKEAGKGAGKEPMLILCNLSGAAMNQFLSELRKRGQYVPLKASLTETNRNWKLSKLYRALCMEHQSMTGENI